MVAAGAVVAKDVPPRTIVAGVPAAVVRSRPAGVGMEHGYRPNWL